MSHHQIHPDFASRSWCMEIINSPLTESIPWPSRPDAAPVPVDHPCSFFGYTLNTPTGVRAGHVMWQGPAEASGAGQALLVSMGEGLNYFPHTLHGGMVAALIDEAMGLLVFRMMGWETGVGSDTFTVNMDINLRGRVETPCVCLIRAWADTEEAVKRGQKWTDMRKLWGRAAIEDVTGRTLIEARYLFIRARKAERL